MRNANFGISGTAAVVPGVGYVVHFPGYATSPRAAQATRNMAPREPELEIEGKTSKCKVDCSPQTAKPWHRANRVQAPQALAVS